MSDANITVEKQGDITIVHITRKDVRNAVDGPTAQALADAFRAFEADDTSRVAILHGQYGTFCAGADLKAFSAQDGRGNRLDPEGDGPMGPSRMMLKKPVIAAIEGHAVAGGLELALWCDMRVASEDAILGVFCRRFGVPLIDGGTVRLPRLIGMSRALDLILTGRPVEAQEALAFGLVNRVVPIGQSLHHALGLAQTLATFPQRCMLADRQSVYEQAHLSLEDALSNEFALGREALDEARLGAQRFADGAGRGGVFE